MKKLLFIPLLFCVVIAFSQNVQHEINEQVWKPFIRSFNDRDAKSFLAVHSKDVMRAPRDS
jgi:hypothetical protein